MENRKAIRARVLLKRARARLSGDTLGLLEAVLRDAHPTDARWVIESIEPARFEVVPGIPGAEFGPGGARAQFVTIRRGTT